MKQYRLQTRMDVADALKAKGMTARSFENVESGPNGEEFLQVTIDQPTGVDQDQIHRLLWEAFDGAARVCTLTRLENRFYDMVIQIGGPFDYVLPLDDQQIEIHSTGNWI